MSSAGAPRRPRELERAESLGGADAYWATFDLVDENGSVERRARVVIVRPGEHRWHPHVAPTSSTSWPMLLVLGYAAREAVFDEHLEDFEGLVRRVDIRPPAR